MVVSSARRISAIDSESVADDEACAGAAKPENGRSDLLRLTKAPNRLIFQVVFHGVPHAAQIDPVHALKFFAAGISGFHGGRQYDDVIERRIPPPKRGYGLSDPCCYLSLLGDIAAGANCLVTCGDEFFCCG